MNEVAKYFDERAENWDSTENRAQGAVLSFVDRASWCLFTWMQRFLM